MTEKQLKALKVPHEVGAPSSRISEIKNESTRCRRRAMSPNFTVRFSVATPCATYMDIHETARPGRSRLAAHVGRSGPASMPDGQGADDASPDDDSVVSEEPAPAIAAPGQPDRNGVIWNDASNGPAMRLRGGAEPAPARTVLILPYYEEPGRARAVLWEDPNPWRRIWQNALPSRVGGRDAAIVVPLGDVRRYCERPQQCRLVRRLRRGGKAAPPL